MIYIKFLIFIFANIYTFIDCKEIKLYAIYNAENDKVSTVNNINELDLSSNSSLAGYAHYEDLINETGWAKLEISTNENVSDSIQAYSAGLLEGKLTNYLIKYQYNNAFTNFCKNKKDYCQKLKLFLNNNLSFMKSMIKEYRKTQPYWHHVALILEQLSGLQDGFQAKESKPHFNIDLFNIYLLNVIIDVSDLNYVIDPKYYDQMVGSGSCSVLIKILPDKSDLYVSHVTWNSYSNLLRILKLYNLKLHELPNSNKIISGYSNAFSSYPGNLASVDDFNMLSSGLVTTETTIVNYNMSLFSSITEKIVLEWIRSIVANRLANNGNEWSKLFSLYNSGTYNNQWFIIDYKLFKPYLPLKKGLLTIVEQMPTLVHTEDITHVLESETYFASYNIPYNKMIFNLSGYQEKVKKYDDSFTYENCPRAKIFKRDHVKVTDINTIIKLMRSNNYLVDELSKCLKCIPIPNAANAISSRNDLNPKNGKYPFPSLGHRPHGGSDMKVTSCKMYDKLKFVAVSGPTYDNVPPFDWETSDFKESVPHEGHPQIFLFKPVLVDWKQIN